DLALLAREAMRLPLFREVVGTHHIVIPATATHRRYDLTSINYFIDWYPGADGVKPGWTGDAGLCLVESASRFGRHLIGVVLNTPNLDTDIRDLFNYGYGTFQWIESHPYPDTPLRTIPMGTPADPMLYFPVSGHTVRAGFLAYFKAHGRMTT